MISKLKAIARLRESAAARINIPDELKKLGFKEDRAMSGSRGMYLITAYKPTSKAKIPVSFEIHTHADEEPIRYETMGLALPKTEYTSYQLFAKDLLARLK